MRKNRRSRAAAVARESLESGTAATAHRLRGQRSCVLDPASDDDSADQRRRLERARPGSTARRRSWLGRPPRRRARGATLRLRTPRDDAWPDPLHAAERGPHLRGGYPGRLRAPCASSFAPETDWILSGINPGGNLGTDIYHSGTVAAVREGVIRGVPGIALSHYIARGKAIDWPRAGRSPAKR